MQDYINQHIQVKLDIEECSATYEDWQMESKLLVGLTKPPSADHGHVTLLTERDGWCGIYALIQSIVDFNVHHTTARLHVPTVHQLMKIVNGDNYQHALKDNATPGGYEAFHENRDWFSTEQLDCMPDATPARLLSWFDRKNRKISKQINTTQTHISWYSMSLLLLRT